MSYAIIAIGLILLVEGLLWLVAPKGFADLLAKAAPNELRVYGAFGMLLGLFVIWYELTS